MANRTFVTEHCREPIPFICHVTNLCTPKVVVGNKSDPTRNFYATKRCKKATYIRNSHAEN
jgi:hypothetical protein